jgi:hypothetical protein
LTSLSIYMDLPVDVKLQVVLEFKFCLAVHTFL